MASGRTVALSIACFAAGLAIGGGGYAFIAKRQTAVAPETRPSPQLTPFERVNLLVTEGRAKASENDLPGALKSYDEALDVLTAELKRVGVAAESFEVRSHYEKTNREWEDLVDRFETPEYEARVPAIDVLSPEGRRVVGWGRSRGIEMNFGSHELVLVGAEVPGERIKGAASFGLLREAPWHDIVLDMNFTIISGDFQLYLRYWPDKRNFMLAFNQQSGYELKKPYQMTLRIKGNSVEMLQPDQNPQSDVLKWNTSRTGGVGFGLNPGTRVIVSSCEVKVLR